MWTMFVKPRSYPPTAVRALWLFGVIAALIVCSHFCRAVLAEGASANAAESAALTENPLPPPAEELIQRWVDDLGADAFSVRQSAAEQLLSAGLSARGALQELVDCPEPETRAAARRLVALIDRAEFQQRLSAFAADTDGRLGLTLPGWERFRERVGGDAASRRLFVEMHEREAALLASGFGTDPQSIDDRWQARLNRLVQWQSAVALGSEPPSIGSCAAIIFMGAAGEMELSDRSTLLVDSLVQQPPARDHLQTGEFRDAFRRLVVAWIRDCPNQNEELLKRRLSFASANQFQEVVPWALTVAAGKDEYARYQPATRATAILLVGQLGKPQHIDALEPLLTDRAVCSMIGPGRPGTNVQVRDVALMVMLHLAGERLSDYGYMDTFLQPQQLLQFPPVEIAGGERRDEAIAKWRAWRARQKRDTQVVPAEHRKVQAAE
jgi:hypothetical protein